MKTKTQTTKIRSVILGSAFLISLAVYACPNTAASKYDGVSDGCLDCGSWGWAPGKQSGSGCTIWEYDVADAACSCSQGTQCGSNDYQYFLHARRLSGNCNGSKQCAVTSTGSWFDATAYQHFTSTCPS